MLALVVTASFVLTLPSAAGASCTWKPTPTLNPMSNNQFDGISGSSATDVWAVGLTASSPVALTLAEHWNGTRWSVATTPNPSQGANILSAAADLSKTDAWAVGFQGVRGNPQALIIHWNGRAWRQVAAPVLNGFSTNLFRMTAISSTDVWAVGQSINLSSGLPAPLVEHWNGTAWKIIPIPNPGTFGSVVDAVSGTAANDVWVAGGSFTNSSHSSLVTLIEHWNGFKWKIVASKNANNNDNLFNALAAVANNDAWAIGDYYTGSIFQTLIEHWNGSAWSIVKSPNVGTGGDGLFGAAALSSTAVVAVGAVFIAGGGETTLALKWNGTRWAVLKSPNLPGGYPDLFFDAHAVPGSTTLWAAGYSTFPGTGNPDQTLAARYQCTASMDLFNPGDDDGLTPSRISFPPTGTIFAPRVLP